MARGDLDEEVIMEVLPTRSPAALDHVLEELRECTSISGRVSLLRREMRRLANMKAERQVWLHAVLYLLLHLDQKRSVRAAASHFLETGVKRRTLGSVAYATRRQHRSALWEYLKEGIMTSSNFKYLVGRIVAYRQDRSTDLAPMMRTVHGRDDFRGNRHTRYGHRMEPRARMAYKAAIFHSHDRRPYFKLRGLYFSPANPLVACSPDAIFVCQCRKAHCRGTWLLEVKCPSKLRNAEPEVAADGNGLAQQANGTYYLPTNHRWYYQVQGQMGITGIHHCDVVVYTRKNILIVPVPFNEAFFRDRIMANLDWFVVEYLYQELLRMAGVSELFAAVRPC